MAMINCPECGQEISDMAEACPNCGYPLKKKEEEAKQNEEESRNSSTREHNTHHPFRVFLIFFVFFLTTGLINSITKPEPKSGGSDNHEKPISEVMVDIRGVLETSFGKNVRMKSDNNMIIAEVWYDGVAEDATLAKSGDKEMLGAWDDTITALKKLAGNMQDYLRATGHNDMSAVINLQNDKKTSKTLLSVTKTSVLLDAVNGS